MLLTSGQKDAMAENDDLKSCVAGKVHPIWRTKDGYYTIRTDSTRNKIYKKQVYK